MLWIYQCSSSPFQALKTSSLGLILCLYTLNTSSWLLKKKLQRPIRACWGSAEYFGHSTGCEIKENAYFYALSGSHLQGLTRRSPPFSPAFFIHPCNTFLLSTCCMPDFMPRGRISSVSKTQPLAMHLSGAWEWELEASCRWLARALLPSRDQGL